LLGAAIGVLFVDVESLIFNVFRPDLLPDPLAISNIVPGIVTGVFATYLGLQSSPRPVGD
jgi:hypothetical protein